MQTHQLRPLEEGMEPTMPLPGYCAFKFRKADSSKAKSARSINFIVAFPQLFMAAKSSLRSELPGGYLPLHD